MRRKIWSGACAAALTLMLMCGSASAGELVDSTPSRADDITAGVDVTQGKQTEYEELAEITDTSYTSDNHVAVYATATSRVVVSIPKTVIMGQTGEAGVFSGEYAAEISGDIAGSQTVIITPEVTAQMIESGGKDGSGITTEATINGGSSLRVSANDLLHGATVRAAGEVKASGVSAGVWSCGLTFHVVVAND